MKDCDLQHKDKDWCSQTHLLRLACFVGHILFYIAWLSIGLTIYGFAVALMAASAIVRQITGR